MDHDDNQRYRSICNQTAANAPINELDDYFVDSSTNDITTVTKSLNTKLCVLIALLSFFVLCNFLALCVVAYYVNSYDRYVRVYMHNMTSPDLPSAPFSAGRMSNLSSQVYDMVNVAHLTTSVMSNATSLDNARFNEFNVDDEIHKSQEERAHQIQQRLTTINQTLGSVKRMTDMIASAHTITLMDAMSGVLKDKVASVDMNAVNQLLLTASDDHIINHTIHLFDKTLDKVDAYEKTSIGAIDLLTQALNVWKSRGSLEEEAKSSKVEWSRM
eukprot:gene25965-31788_t